MALGHEENAPPPRKSPFPLDSSRLSEGAGANKTPEVEPGDETGWVGLGRCTRSAIGGTASEARLCAYSGDDEKRQKIGSDNYAAGTAALTWYFAVPPASP